MNSLQLSRYDDLNYAISDDVKNISYADLSLISDIFGYIFKNVYKYNSQQRILVKVKKDCDFVIAFIALFKIGCIPVTTTMFDIENINKITDIDHILTSDTLNSVSENAHKIISQHDKFDISKFKYGYYHYNANDIVYCIFTSGTTGVPKKFDVTSKMFEHFLNSFDQISNYFDSKIKSLSLSAISFDPIYIEIFYVIYKKGFVYVSSYDQITESYCDVLEKYNINFVNLSSNFMSNMYLSGDTNNIPNINTIISGGEAINKRTTKKIITKCNNLIQIYGLVETTIIATYKIVKNIKDNTNIGVNFPGYNVYLSESNEIVVDSVCSKGVLHTGDYGYYDNDKNIIYSGRSVLKRLGHRINFQTVAETIIDKIIEVNDVHLAVVKNSLMIFVKSSTKNKSAVVKNIRKICADMFGSHSIPDKYYFVEKYFINAHQKIDVQKMIKEYSEYIHIFDPLNISIRENVEYWIQTLIESMIGEHFVNFTLESKIKLKSLGITSIDKIIIYDTINKKCPITFSDFHSCERVIDIIDLILSTTVKKDCLNIDFGTKNIVNMLMENNFDLDINLDQQGLTSINFFRLQSYLKRKYGYFLKSAKETPRKIHDDVVNKKNLTSEGSDYVYVDKHSKSDIILVFVYPISGNSVVYDIFSLFMNHNMIFLNYPQTTYTTLEELAKHHCDEISGLVKDKIPVLIGWSFGGILAVAMSDYYNKYFGIINNLVVLDSYFNFDIRDKENNWQMFIEDFNSKIPYLNLEYVHTTVRNLLNMSFDYKLPDYTGRMLYIQSENKKEDNQWHKLFPNAAYMYHTIDAKHHNFFQDKYIPYLLIYVERFISSINSCAQISYQNINKNSLCIFDVDGTLTDDPYRLNKNPTVRKNIVDLLLSVESLIICSAHPNFEQTVDLLKKIGLEKYIDDKVETFTDNNMFVKKCGKCISVKYVNNASNYFMAKIASIKYSGLNNVSSVTLIDDNDDVINYNRQYVSNLSGMVVQFCNVAQSIL